MGPTALAWWRVERWREKIASFSIWFEFGWFSFRLFKLQWHRSLILALHLCLSVLSLLRHYRLSHRVSRDIRQNKNERLIKKNEKIFSGAKYWEWLRFSLAFWTIFQARRAYSGIGVVYHLSLLQPFQEYQIITRQEPNAIQNIHPISSVRRDSKLKVLGKFSI